MEESKPKRRQNTEEGGYMHMCWDRPKASPNVLCRLYQTVGRGVTIGGGGEIIG